MHLPYFYSRVFKTVKPIIYNTQTYLSPNKKTSTFVHQLFCFLFFVFCAVSSILFFGEGGDAWQQAKEGRDTGRVTDKVKSEHAGAVFYHQHRITQQRTKEEEKG